MKRSILVAVIGYIIGIIWGLYFKFSIVFLYAIFIAITAIIYFIKKFFNQKKQFSFLSISRYFRYVKLILNKKVIFIIVSISILSNTIVISKNLKYDNLYKDLKNIELTGIIVSSKKEKDYKNVYKIKVEEVHSLKKYKGTYLYLNVNKKLELSYGDKVKVYGEYEEPSTQRNYGGFNYKEYLKTLKIYGNVNGKNVKILDKNKTNQISIKINKMKEKIKNNAKEILDENTYPIFLGLIFGDTSQIDEEIKENFSTSNISHILAVSGMHISYIIFGITIALNKIIGKNKGKAITILILLMYVTITGFFPSIIRASCMGIMTLIGGLIHRKNDIWTSISISLFITLVYNPYLITNLGLQFSYMGTIGIILFRKNILKMLNKGKENKSKVKEILAVTISAQTLILPLMLFHLNSFGMYFLITNILISLIIGPIVIIGFIFLIFLILNLNIAKLISYVFKLGLQLILLISKISMLPMSKIYVRTPKIIEIILFYFVVIMINIFYVVKTTKNPGNLILRVKYTIQLLKYNFRKQKNKYIKIIILILLIIIIILIFIPKNLQINFIDVGQGDSCFIITPNNKTILIDGGGNELGNFDVGKSTLLPYILDKGYTQIDYIFISHFDSDHVGRFTNYYERIESR